MIKLKCETSDKALLTQMTPFQGNLKKRKPGDIQELWESLKNDGLLMPFALWAHDEKLYILDGHGRYQALVSAALEDATILQQQFPYILINAETETDARKALLQIVSTYGKISKDGLQTFTAQIVNYKAPVIKYTYTAPKVSNKTTAIDSGMQIIRLRVPKEKAEQFKNIIKDVEWIEVY